MERHSKAKTSIDMAKKLLLSFSSIGDSNSKKQDGYPPVPTSKMPIARHQRSNTVRPRTAYFSGVDDSDGPTSATIGGHTMLGSNTGEHVISHPITLTKAIKPKEKKKVNRSATFKKEKKEDKKEEKERLSGLTNAVHHSSTATEEKYRVSEIQYINCIKELQSSLEEMLVRVWMRLHAYRYTLYCPLHD